MEPIAAWGDFLETTRRGYSCDCPLGALQELMDERDRHAPLANRGGDPLHGTGPHIAAAEDPRHAGLEQVGVSLVGPAARLDRRLAREHVAASIAGDLLRQPRGLRVGADE